MRRTESPVLALSTVKFTCSLLNPPPATTQRPFGSHAPIVPTCGVFQIFLPLGISHAVMLVLPEAVKSVWLSPLKNTRWTWSLPFSSGLSTRPLVHSSLSFFRFQSCRSCPVRPPASHLPSGETATQLMPP